jgi:ribosomal protein L11 methyltransferase
MRDYILEIAIDDPASEELIQSRLFLTRSKGNVVIGARIDAYFDDAEARDEAAELLREFKTAKIERERTDWLEHYRQSLEPLHIGARFIVAPDASLIPNGTDKLSLIVPQEQAFGTGSHETTSLCIEILESLPLEGTRGLDIGAGSGILAMAMLRLGARKAIAFDNDADAYGALRDNRSRNRIDEQQLALFIGSVEALRGGAFDVLTMNIIPEVIIPLLPLTVPRMAANARLILSGVLTVKRDDVTASALAHGLQLVHERNKGEWWAGVFAR